VKTLESTALSQFVSQIFQGAGAPAASADFVAASLVKSNLVGHDSHGVIRVPQYLNEIASGELKPAALPELARETSVIALIEANFGFGQVAADLAMKRAISKAKEQGLAAAGLLNSNHVGRLGEWVELATAENMIALAFCNGGRPGGIVTPFGGASPLLGTNPLAAAVPVAGQPPIIIDFSTSVVAEGKVRVAFNKGDTIPEGWIQDAEGHPSTRPADLYAGGTLLPIAGHKGSALSLLVELLGGLLLGQGAPGLKGYERFKNGVLFIVLQVDAFRSPTDFLQDSAEFLGHLKAVKPAPGFSEVLSPGEPERRSAQKRQREGIPMDDTTFKQLLEAAAEYGVGHLA
jgi:LDH2 family malate/lactate/ureidoglycolate dehydrogenase